ncbi:MAG: hypothetical protein J1F61_06090 [Clostridiales bacterium]|nr:hypothetical protein [Clostridiales bacterium]
MKYEEFDKLIEENNRPKKQERLQRIKERLSYFAESVNSAQKPATQGATLAESPSAAEKQAQKSASKWRTSFKNFFKQPARLAACVSAAVAVVCLAIMLPFTLNSGSGSQTATTSPSTTPEDRYCAAATCKQIELKYSLKEYSQLNKLSLLYVDWYDVADIKTSMHVNDEDSTDIVYYEEALKHKYTGSIVELYITNLRTHVDKLEDYKKSCKNVYTVYTAYTAKHSKVDVFWGFDRLAYGKPYLYKAWFKYGNYIYVLVLRYPVNENSIFELIDSMLA